MSIQYKKEVRPLEDVLLYLAHQQQRYIVEGKDQEGNVYFTIEIYFTRCV